MKKAILFYAFLVHFFAAPILLMAQCTPGDEISCPDPENNGEICPETLPNGIIDEVYSQEFTIIPPAEYIIDSASGAAIDLHHITLKSIDNIPSGIGWETNSVDSIFVVGTYYCVLLEGTPTEKGNFPLKIVVDVFIPGLFGSPPIYVATVTDSTSLFIQVTDPEGMSDYLSPNMSRLSCSPNPFQDRVEVNFTQRDRGPVTFEVFNLLGERLHSESILTEAGENTIHYFGRDLDYGVYLFSIRDDRGVSTGRIIKSNP